MTNLEDCGPMTGVTLVLVTGVGPGGVRLLTWAVGWGVDLGLCGFGALCE